MHYKGLPYTQSWISYPEIGRLWDELRITPDDAQRKPGPRCTSPVLLLRTDSFGQDSLDRLYDMGLPEVRGGVQTSNGVFTRIVSTLNIAMTLDNLFRKPHVPLLFPFPQSFEQAQQVQSTITRLFPVIRRLVVPSVPNILDERGKEYFVGTRKQEFNVSSLDELRP